MDKYTVTVDKRAFEALLAMLGKVQEAARAVDAPISEAILESPVGGYPELSRRLRAYAEVQNNLLGSLVQVLRTNDRDGNITLYPDGETGIFFRYDSGYHGAMMYHAAGDGDPLKGSFSIHT